MTNQQVAFSISKAITDGYINFMTNLLLDCNLPTDLADLPVKFTEPIYGSQSPSFTEFMAPGIIIIIIFFLAVGLTGEAFIAEKLVRNFITRWKFRRNFLPFRFSVKSILANIES